MQDRVTSFAVVIRNFGTRQSTGEQFNNAKHLVANPIEREG